MKTSLNKRKLLGLTTLAAVMLLMPISGFASNALVKNTGVSDETLFSILVVVAILQLVLISVTAAAIKSIAANHELWQMRWKNKAGALIAFFMLASGNELMAQSPSFDSLVTMDDTGFVMLIIINLVLLATFLYLASKLNGLMRMMMKDETGEVPESFLEKVNEVLTNAVPVEKEQEIELDHEYDGIRELDNRLPPWWLWGFYASIVFAVVYLFNYHISETAPLQIEEYTAEVAEAEAAKAEFLATQDNVVDESNVQYLSDASTLSAGQKTFKLYCAPCHAEHGGSAPGGVGPNLTDDYWIHGGSINDIYKTIKYGVPAKGMVSWEAQLSPQKIQEVSSYIMSIHGTNPPNPKEPQGELFVPEKTDEEPAPEAMTDSLSVADGTETSE